MIALPPGCDVAAARRALTQAFRAAGLDTPDVDARVLTGHALGLDHAGLAAEGPRRLTETERATIAGLAARRLAREPVARIVGQWEFWGLPLVLGPATLVPRPDTETVVEAALAAIDRDGPRTRSLRVADLGTGTGALLLALLSELPEAFGVGTDISVDALKTAHANARALGFAGRTAFVVCDFGRALASCDLVVSNPPYIASAEIAGLEPEVRRYDPPAALDGGADGLDAYRAIAADATRLLAPGGHLVVELGSGQGPAVAGLLTAAGLVVTEPPRPDLGGIPRALRAGRRFRSPGNP